MEKQIKMTDYIKISDLSKGMIIWKDDDILGVTGDTLPNEYYDSCCIKIKGNYFDYELIKRED